jgi:hypothetical protein
LAHRTAELSCEDVTVRPHRECGELPEDLGLASFDSTDPKNFAKICCVPGWDLREDLGDVFVGWLGVCS